MHPMVAAKVEELARLTDALRQFAKDTNGHAARMADEKETMQQEIWALQRDLSVLKRIQDEFQEVETANERYREQRAAIKQGLERILKHTKSLGLEFED